MRSSWRGSYMVLDSEDEERISYAGPLAQLLMGHRAGETVEGKTEPGKCS